MNKFGNFLWRSAFSIVFGWYYKTKVYGRDEFPKEGPVIVVPNHLSNFDPPVLGYAIPRHAHFMAKAELFVNPISRFFCTWLGAFPVHRGTVDKIAIRHAMGLLKHKEVLGIFAEGSRQKPGKLGRFHDGAASIALRTGVGIVPIATIGTYDIQRHGVAIIIGELIPVRKDKATAENIKAVNEAVKNAIQRMIDDYESGRYEDTPYRSGFML